MVQIVLKARLALFILLIVVNSPPVQPFGFGVVDFDNVAKAADFFWDIYKNGTSAYGTVDTILESVTSNPIFNMEQIFNVEMVEVEHQESMSTGQKDIIEIANTLHNYYNDLIKYMKSETTANDPDFKKFMSNIASDKIPLALRRIYRHFFNEKKSFKRTSFINYLHKDTQANFSQICNSPTSPHELLYEIYNIVMKLETQAIFLISVSYRTLELIDKKPGHYESNAKSTFELFSLRANMYTKLFEGLLDEASRALRSCDPDNHKRGKTFLEIERLVGTVLLQADATNSEHRYAFGCWRHAMESSHRQYFGCPSGQGCTPEIDACYGDLEDCENASDNLVCPGDWNNGDTRRFTWIIDEGYDRKYGRTDIACRSKLKYMGAIGKIFMYNYLCRCTCFEYDHNGKGNNFVSVMPVTSDILKNKVVTGIKFVKTHDIIQLKIQEGVLTAGAKIIPSSVHWSDPEQLSYDVEMSQLKQRYVFYRRNIGDDTYQEIKNDVDIAVLTRYKKTINLDELYVPKDHVITGVKFSRIITSNKANPQPLQLEIQATPFDYKTGKLILESDGEETSTWINADNLLETIDGIDESTKMSLKAIYGPPRNRTQIFHEEHSKGPVYSQRTVPDLIPNTFIEFDKTSLEGDYGQTVIPLLDALPVNASLPAPLSGLSIIHKAQEEYGGFLSFRIMTINRSGRVQYNSTNLPNIWK